MKHFLKDVFFPQDWWKALLGLVALVIFLGIILPAVMGWMFGSPETRRNNSAPERYEEFLR